MVREIKQEPDSDGISGDRQDSRSHNRRNHHREDEKKPSFKVKEEPSSPVHDRRQRNRSPSHRTRQVSDGRERIHDRNDRRDRKRRHDDHSRSLNPSSSANRSDTSRRTKRESSLSPGEIKDEHKSRWGTDPAVKTEPQAKLEAPSLALSGALIKETNTYRGVVINYSEPPEAKLPKRRWRLYPFKESEEFKPLYIHRQTAYLIGRDKRICDMPLLHPSISKQHAVLQYRSVPYTKDDGSQGRAIRPYIIDLNSPNGTSLNGNPIEPQKYYELKEKDVLKFGYSSRDYVLLHEKSAKDVDSDS